jgi:Protein of unknown function (DUF3551)
MRAIALAVLLSLVFGVYGAFADSSSAYPYCLMTGPAQDCSYNTIAQCLASKRGNADFCEPNNWYGGSRGRSRNPQ